MSNNYQRAIYNMFSSKTIAYNAGLSKALGSVKAGLLIAQLLFWEGKGSNKEWFYKTANELYDETGMTESEQTTAIKLCKSLNILETKLAGIPAKRHFKINKEAVIELLASLKKSGKLASMKSIKSFKDKSETTTYSTQENTSNNNFLLERRDLSKKMSVNNFNKRDP